jgi:hypothetical protein
LLDIVQSLGGPAALGRARRLGSGSTEPWLIVDADDDRARRGAYHALRRREFVELQGLFAAHDRDDFDAHAATRRLVAVGPDDRVLGGVRIHPAAEGGDAIGWWQGSRLVVDAGTGRARGRIGSALVRAACARALDVGALRFDAGG